MCALRLLAAVMLQLCASSCAATAESEIETADEAMSTADLAAANAEIVKLHGAVVVFDRDVTPGTYRGNNCHLRALGEQRDIVRGTTYVVRRVTIEDNRAPRVETYLDKQDQPDWLVPKGFMSPERLYISWLAPAPTTETFKAAVARSMPVTWK